MSTFVSNLISKRFWYPALIVLCLAGTYSLGLTVRRMVLDAQHASIGPDMPFTLESALHYRRVKIMYDRGELPKIDEAVQFPEGINIREIDAVTSEPVQAALAHLFPDSIPFPDRIRWIEAGWFCLTMPLLVLFLRCWTGSWVAGVVAASLYAISLSSVLRSTGQEISRENFSFPWLIAAYVAAAVYFHGKEGASRICWALLSAFFFAMALVSWDMTQYVLGVLTLGISFHILLNGVALNRALLRYFAILTGMVVAIGLLNPYYRFHGLAFSPLTAWMVSNLVCGLWYFGDARNSKRMDSGGSHALQRWIYPSLVIAGPLALMLVAGTVSAYGASYEHFAELLYAKIRFLNVKPSDPSLMTYYQRIMWVPSLHSATWGLTKWLFPASLWGSGLVAAVAFVTSFKRPDPLISHWILLFGLSIAAYVLFVRFHVYVALSASVLAGWAYGRLHRASIAWRGIVLLFIALVMMAEGGHTLRQRYSMGRPNVYYTELKELADWLVKEVAPEPVLANMGVSAYIAAYGKCAIVIHPKFEDPVVRHKLEHYGELLFGQDEKALRDWMDELGVRYYVYSKGEFSHESPEYQMRYFVNMMEPGDNVAARRFERDDETLRYFKRLWGNRKYVVYKTFSREEEKTAELKADGAMEMLQNGNLAAAEKLAVEAVGIDPNQETALKVLRHVGSLREQGLAERIGRKAP